MQGCWRVAPSSNVPIILLAVLKLPSQGKGSAGISHSCSALPSGTGSEEVALIKTNRPFCKSSLLTSEYPKLTISHLLYTTTYGSDIRNVPTDLCAAKSHKHLDNVSLLMWVVGSILCRIVNRNTVADFMGCFL